MPAKSGNDLPLALPPFFIHTKHPCFFVTRVYDARPMQHLIRKAFSPLSFFSWVIFLFCALTSTHVIAVSDQSLDQITLKEALQQQILVEVEKQLLVDRDRITVYVNDRRLVVPKCDQDFVITLPFSDRSTVSATCTEQGWQKYIRVSVGDYRSLMVYRRNMTAGDIVKRGDFKFVDGRGMSEDQALVETIDQIINRSLKKNVIANQPVLASDFSLDKLPTFRTEEAVETQVVIATTTINRGVRLHKSMFERQIRRGRLPSDLIFGTDELNHLEANRMIVAGDTLRRSMVSLAPAVRKGDLIKIRIEKDALSVTAMVRALNDGSVGDVIEVVNAESGRPLQAKIVDVGSLEII